MDRSSAAAPTPWWSGSSLTRVTSWLLVLIITFGFLSAMPRPAGAQDAPTRVMPALLDKASKEPESDIRVIVQRFKGDVTADDYVVKVKAGKKVKEVKADAFVATVKGKHLADIGKHKAVKYVTVDAPMVNMVAATTVSDINLATNYAKSVKANQLWGSAITGANVGVAVIDTGVTPRACDFTTSGTNRVVASQRFNSLTTNMNDGYGHGSHVAGIIAGNNTQCTDTTVKGKYVGIAPQANIINVKAADDTGMSYTSDVVNAIDWVIANRVTHNIRVLNLSLVSSVAESYKTSILSAAAERAWFNGIFVVVSAGNGGPDTLKFAPANDPFVLTVGAVGENGTTAVGDDTLAPWSSYGTTQDGIVKPDVVAPGRNMTSVLSSGAAGLAKQFPERVTGNYIWLSGTSMAAPVASGIAALAFQAHPEWTNDQVKWLLMNTATTLGTTTVTTDPTTGLSTTSFTPYVGQGSGEVDALAVVTYAGTPGLANQGYTISSQLTTVNGETTYSSSSWSSSSWSSSSWSSSSWSSSSWSSSSWSSSSWSSSSWSSNTWASTKFQ